MTNKTVTLIKGDPLTNVNLVRWAGDPNFYKVRSGDSQKETLVNVNQIVKIEDYIEPDLSMAEPKIY